MAQRSTGFRVFETGPRQAYTMSTVDVQFLGQPWQDGTNLDDFLEEIVSQSEPDHLRIAVAWAKRSGLGRIKPYLDDWRKRGGQIDLIVGLSEGGATRQGLELALEVADRVHLFHDLSGRTFHPKVYLAETAEAVNLLVGSNNMTAGGLYFNYEAALALRVPASGGQKPMVIQQANAWFGRLLTDPDCCRELTSGNLDGLVADKANRIGDEDQRRSAAGNEIGAPEEVDGVGPTDGDDAAPFFGRSQSAKKKARHDPPAAVGTGGGTVVSQPGGWVQGGTGTPAQPAPPVPAPSGAAAPPAQPRQAVERWSKRLKGTDAQQPPGGNTSPTYNLRLAAAGHPIDIRTYFRDTFFHTTAWQADPVDASIEYTVVDMEVLIHGTSHGVHTFRIDHNLNRVSGQGNVPTVLKWGVLGIYMRTNNHVDDWVLLEKFDDDTFELRIEAADPMTR